MTIDLDSRVTSAFDRPVSKLIYSANPWSFARQAMALGAEVHESDLVPDGQAFLVDLNAIARAREEMHERIGASLLF